MIKVVVIGGGAAGFFAAINIAEKIPDAQIVLLEKSRNVLQKVKVSGGGRCNVTNARTSPAELVPFYPRGNKKLHTLFKKFSTSNMVEWLTEHGVATKTERDLRMFPVSDSSKTIIDCFLDAAKRNRIDIRLGEPCVKLTHNQSWEVVTTNRAYYADHVVFASGSSPKAWGLLEDLGLKMTKIVPSLFTFNIKDARLRDLQGLTFEQASVKVAGTKLTDSGPLLITHWGLSGPAILKLSSWGAYELNSKSYQFDILVNFLDQASDDVHASLMQYKQGHPKRTIVKYPLFELPRRFWERLVQTCGISAELTFQDLGKKQTNKLVEELTQARFHVSGKSTFKEEFVTAGGVDLSEVSLETFECKRYPGLYLAGEVLDIDALTGGFNFQACWSAGWVISEHIQLLSSDNTRNKD